MHLSLILTVYNRHGNIGFAVAQAAHNTAGSCCAGNGAFIDTAINGSCGLLNLQAGACLIDSANDTAGIGAGNRTLVHRVLYISTKANDTAGMTLAGKGAGKSAVFDNCIVVTHHTADIGKAIVQLCDFAGEATAGDATAVANNTAGIYGIVQVDDRISCAVFNLALK